MRSVDHLDAILGDARVAGLPVLPIGEGTNVLFAGDYPGLVLRLQLGGVVETPADGDAMTIRAAAGERWPPLVRRTVARDWYGLENLTDIPGSVGAAPIQNIGAYGAELADVLVEVDTYDLADGGRATVAAANCQLGYRSSVFKLQPDRRVVTSVVLRLQPASRAEIRAGYPGVADQLRRLGAGARPTARQLSDAIGQLRAQKLPDPATHPNAGSFFKNPVVAADVYAALHEQSAAPGWPVGDGAVKLSAAWLIEQCGLRGRRWGAVAVSRRHALVLVNEGCRSGQELVAAAAAIRDAVEERFGVRLETEVRVVESEERTSP